MKEMFKVLKKVYLEDEKDVLNILFWGSIVMIAVAFLAKDFVTIERYNAIMRMYPRWLTVLSPKWYTYEYYIGNLNGGIIAGIGLLITTEIRKAYVRMNKFVK